jgi:hypothetical protein
MSDEQKRETEKKERKGSRQSHRYVTNIEEAK